MLLRARGNLLVRIQIICQKFSSFGLLLCKILSCEPCTQSRGICYSKTCSYPLFWNPCNSEPAQTNTNFRRQMFLWILAWKWHAGEARAPICNMRYWRRTHLGHNWPSNSSVSLAEVPFLPSRLDCFHHSQNWMTWILLMNHQQNHRRHHSTHHHHCLIASQPAQPALLPPAIFSGSFRNWRHNCYSSIIVHIPTVASSHPFHHIHIMFHILVLPTYQTVRCLRG